jgi:hypothetical protein
MKTMRFIPRGQALVASVLALVAGLRGILFSLPELGFVTIRKGSFEWVPPAARPLSLDDDAGAGIALAQEG